MTVPAADPGPSAWRHTSIVERWRESERATTLRVDAEGWRGHVAGQRVDVRLTAEDGYQATRSYSIASAPSDATLELTVERISDGEVSPWLADEAMVGDEFEIRGPIGGWFTWRPSDDASPLVLIGGGSGLVPLRAMAREAVLRAPDVPIRLLVSTRELDTLLFAQELDDLAGLPGNRVIHTLTRRARDDWDGPTGRIDAGMVTELLRDVARPRAVYVCGPTGFVDHAADLLFGVGVEQEVVRTERFGPSS